MQDKPLDAKQIAKELNVSEWTSRKMLKGIMATDRVMADKHTKKRVYSIEIVDKLRNERSKYLRKTFKQKVATVPSEDLPPPHWQLVNETLNKVVR